MSASKAGRQVDKVTWRPLEVGALTLLGLAALCGIGGVFLSFVPNVEEGGFSLELLPIFLGLLAAAGSSGVLVWLRRRFKAASVWSALAIPLWFSGLAILGMGGFAALSPGEEDVLTNLGFTLALCWGPGGFLTLVGLLLYGYDYRRTGRRPGKMAGWEQAEPARSAPVHAGKVERAQEYRNHIMVLVRQKKGSAFARHFEEVASKLDRWVARIDQLTDRVTAFEGNPVLQRDIREVPAAIARLKEQLDRESNPQLQMQIQETRARYQDYQRQLDDLTTLMRRTELEVDETLASIGAIYSQLQLFEAKDLDQRRADRLSEDIEEQTDRLSDLLMAMDETYRDASDLAAPPP